MGTAVKSVHVTSTIGRDSLGSVGVERGTHVIEGVHVIIEVLTQDVAGTYMDEHGIDRFSGNHHHTEHPSHDMHHTTSTSASHGNAAKQPAGRDEVAGVKSPQIRQFSWGESVGKTMLVPVTLGKHRVLGVVDTAAQVSLISSDVWARLGFEMEHHLELVQLANAQRDSVMDGHLYTHVGFLLGGRKFYSDFVVADISDEMIIGMDFLKKHKCKIDLEDDSLEIGRHDKVFAVMKGDTDQRYHISRVTLTKKTKIPSHSMQFVSVKVQNPAPVMYAVEPAQKASLFSPRW